MALRGASGRGRRGLVTGAACRPAQKHKPKVPKTPPNAPHTYPPPLTQYYKVTPEELKLGTREEAVVTRIGSKDCAA